ncbi:hypothetical protein IAQ61_005406 [Plenodomus lingam]|uniref:DNA (cytosine-5)-methyltransferase 1 replication foci domain-containing protein n=1 Tax=Leptosphaeria maculans (strain JN3 / isolate v23.1.3 / race Av1-4-5-6-7-8) TaxID=985895 RepID=E4ZZD6_LEPMJ|nr:hypothetical protein LEMA_P109960.1 [Plenodomus lingam JN3]KAH9871227.1 hypothetical protein IAQ61_005406 [Plenodomus lingam]CBX96731.1 hypothetical protein LEMA_P109960.1 [Plenodomus lingam JN3]
MPTPEAAVLRPVDPSITDSDDWDIFILSDARITYESNGKPASLLAAYADTPLKVEGLLETPGREQCHYLLKKPYKPMEIEIRNVNRFSYGEMNDGTLALWAEGGAGWFQIQPAPQYKAIYDGMICAVQILYFVTDIYKEPRKKGGGPSAQLVFQEYAEDARFPCNNPVVAEAIFEEHHLFLMMCFLNRANGIGWSNTPLYQYFRRRHPKDFEMCKARIEGRYVDIRPSNPAPATAPVTDTITTHPARSRALTGKTAAPKVDEAPPKKDENWWEAAALFEFVQKIVNQRVLRVGKNQITLERVAELIVRRYEIEEVQMAQHVLLVHAENLCYMMAHPRRKSISYFTSEPIYHTLVAGHNLSAAEQRRAGAVELRPRKDHATLRGDASDSSDTSDEEEDDDVITTPIRRPPGRRKNGRLSVLRPRSSNFSVKRQGESTKSARGVAGKGKAPVLDQGVPSEESDESENSSSDDEMAMDTPTQALSPGREKRKLDTTHDHLNDDGEPTRRKRSNSAACTPASPPSSAHLSDNDQTQAVAVPPLPLRKPPPSGQPGILTHTVTTPLPTYESNGPRDSWICSFDGCSQRIYGCSKELGRQLITEHLEDHTKGTEKVVGILWREQDRLNLPVSNLIKKIREMGDAKAGLFPALGGQKVEPVRRGL